MKTHKKQHFIPQTYLSAWCDSNCPKKHSPYVWIFKKDSTIGKKKSPGNIFHEKNMYTFHLDNGKRNLALEHGLSQLESMFATVRKTKIEKENNLDLNDRTVLCFFTAAMQARTKVFREFQRKQWGQMLEMMNNMKKSFENASPAQKTSMAALSSIHSSRKSNNKSISYDQVKQVVDNPLQNLLPTMLRASAPLLCKLDLAILLTDSKTGFITSDDPCVWFDPEACKRPPFYRVPGLIDKTIEITLPISPKATLFLNRQGITGYKKINENLLGIQNSKTRFYADEYFIVNSNITKQAWFETGTEPDDSWENMQKKKNKV